MKKQTPSRRARPPRTKETLLPLSTAKVRSLSLENHLAPATVRAGRGNLDQLCCLLRVIYLAFYMRAETAAGADINAYRRAEAALDSCVARVERDEPCLLFDQEQAAVEHVLVLHDEQLGAAPRFRYLEAWERLQRFIVGGARSRLPCEVAV